ncbi:hypothetical protein HYS47_02265 [Candidatus Woesearchaeota archaeon]|nr:hypothetical protein [Candidatus Woesearchaeota archaeon]
MVELEDVYDKDPSRAYDEGGEEYRHAHREFLSDMEFEIYVDKLTVQYQGVFRYPLLLKAIKEWCRRKGYYYEVFSQKMTLVSNGKNASFTFHFQKKFSQLHVSFLILDLTIKNMTDLPSKVGRRDALFSKGGVIAVVNGFLGTSMKHRVEARPRMAFIRGIIDRYIYKLDRPIYPGTVVSDGASLATEIRSFCGLEDKVFREEQARQNEEKQPK